MTSEIARLRRVATRVALVTAALIVAACTRATPEDVALAYGRAVYAYDAATIYRLASTDDHRAKDQKTIAAQLGSPCGLALDVMRQLASFATGSTVAKQIVGSRATVTLDFTLPDGNAPVVRDLAREWDEQRGSPRWQECGSAEDSFLTHRERSAPDTASRPGV